MRATWYATAAEKASRYYTARADRYDAHYRTGLDRAEDDVLAAYLAALLPLRTVTPGVIDLCSGTGLTFDLAGERAPGARSVAVDVSRGMLVQLRAKHPAVLRVEGDVNEPGGDGWAYTAANWCPAPAAIICLFAAEYLDLDVVMPILAARWPGTPVFLHGLRHRRAWSLEPEGWDRGAEQWPCRAARWADLLDGGAIVGTNAAPDWLARRLPHHAARRALAVWSDVPAQRHHHLALMGRLPERI